MKQEYKDRDEIKNFVSLGAGFTTAAILDLPDERFVTVSGEAMILMTANELTTIVAGAMAAMANSTRKETRS